jgi:mycothiol system anti-sigma-R factor
MWVMRCDEIRPRLDAYLDGELPEAERTPLRGHLQDCPDCGPEAAALERLRDDIRRSAPVHRAPEALRSQIRFALRREAAASRPSASLRAPGWLAYAASILLAVAVGSGGTFMLVGERQTDTMAGEIIDSHLRSLLGSHLTDVASSDQHTVKPWFAGRTDLSPPAVDLRMEGFPLVGGRLDVIDGRKVAVLVYRHNQHRIALTLWPSSSSGNAAATIRQHDGFALADWRHDGFEMRAVADISPVEMKAFAIAVDAAVTADR